MTSVGGGGSTAFAHSVTIGATLGAVISQGVAVGTNFSVCGYSGNVFILALHETSTLSLYSFTGGVGSLSAGFTVGTTIGSQELDISYDSGYWYILSTNSSGGSWYSGTFDGTTFANTANGVVYS